MKSRISILVLFLTFIGNAQESISDLLSQHNHKNIPYISVQELASPKTQAIILDTREEREYETSHIKNALFVGYNHFSLDSVLHKISDKNEKIVVYCSIGIRSEKIAYKLKIAGYLHVFNLYGGIFEWKNNDFPVYNSEGKETENVHTYSEKWSKWLKKGHKIY
tara:strand:- start:970 stop:1461 length:492 start_codon:yes stop_codon:yes gene_type:complete